MSAQSKLVLAAVASAILGAALGAAFVWGSQGKAIADLNARVIAADAANQASLQKIDELQASLAAASATAAANAGQTSSPTVKPPASQAATPTAVVKTVKQFTFVKTTSVSGGTRYVSADYAQMLTGDAAATAATAHGDESPPPNDYYIVNDSHKIRKLKVKSGITVTVTSNADGTSDPTGHIITLAKWFSYFKSPTDGNAAIREAPYWIWVKGDTVTKIEQQYLP